MYDNFLFPPKIEKFLILGNKYAQKGVVEHRKAFQDVSGERMLSMT